MAIFDQRNQTVTYQTNIAMQNAVAEVASREDLLKSLEMIRQDGLKAYGADQIPVENWAEAKESLELAKIETEKPQPDKSKLTGLLEKAKGAVKGVVAVAGLYEAMAKLAEMIPHLPF